MRSSRQFSAGTLDLLINGESSRLNATAPGKGVSNYLSHDLHRFRFHVKKIFAHLHMISGIPLDHLSPSSGLASGLGFGGRAYLCLLLGSLPLRLGRSSMAPGRPWPLVLFWFLAQDSNLHVAVVWALHRHRLAADTTEVLSAVRSQGCLWPLGTAKCSNINNYMDMVHSCLQNYY